MEFWHKVLIATVGLTFIIYAFANTFSKTIVVKNKQFIRKHGRGTYNKFVVTDENGNNYEISEDLFKTLQNDAVINVKGYKNLLSDPTITEIL
jgi:alcohol dehydrogenase class IV